MKFPELVTIFEMSGWQALGKLPNPVTGETAVSLEAARNTIDILVLLKEKSRNNLSPGEEQHLDSVIANLQLNFAEEKEKAGRRPAPERQDPPPGEGDGRPEPDAPEREKGDRPAPDEEKEKPG